jgi:hypothetical protein
MMKLFKGRHPDKISLAAALISTAVMVLFAQFVLGHYSRCFWMEEGPNSLGLLLGYSKEDVLAFLSVRTPEQIRCYIDFLMRWDFIFPIVYGLMHILWLRYFFPGVYLLFLIPVFHMGVDWLENVMESGMAEAFLKGKEIDPGLLKWGSIVTSIKWILSFATYMIILTGIGLRIKNYLKNRQTR